jgi:predicted transcriptional regulator
MESILVIPKDEQEYSLVMQLLKRMKITASPIREEKVYKRMTVEEYRREIDRSMEDVKAGRVISQEEMKRQMAQW